MPSSSKAQHNMMEMVAHDPAAAKRLGIKQSVGQDFANADKASGKFRKKRTRADAAAALYTKGKGNG